MKELNFLWCVRKQGCSISKKIFTYVLDSESYFVEYFFAEQIFHGFCYFGYQGCYNYHIIPVLNYHMFSSCYARIFFKKPERCLSSVGFKKNIHGLLDSMRSNFWSKCPCSWKCSTRIRKNALKKLCTFFIKLFSSKDTCLFLRLSTNQN